MSGDYFITRESSICQVLPMLPEKVVVDFANGIDVVRDHVRVQSNRHGMLARFMDGISGTSSRRQAGINASLADGVEGALLMLNDLTSSLARSNLAIERVNDRLSAIVVDVKKIAGFSAETREIVIKLSEELDARYSSLEKDVQRIDFVQRAQLHLDQVFSRWDAGRLSSFSPAARAYIVMEDLWWGDFGAFFRMTESHDKKDKLVETMLNRCISKLSGESGVSPAMRLSIRSWLDAPDSGGAVLLSNQALAYLGDNADHARQPFVYSLTQMPEYSDLPNTLPRITSAEVVVRALKKELFGEVRHVY